jgi:hypothetical protein
MIENVYNKRVKDSKTVLFVSKDTTTAVSIGDTGTNDNTRYWKFKQVTINENVYEIESVSRGKKLGVVDSRPTLVSTDGPTTLWNINIMSDQATAPSDFIDAPSGATWCRVSGSTAYSGYLSEASTDVNACKTKCKNDPQCKSFEYNGSNCWYYGGNESAQTPGLPADAPNKCYVKR